MDAAVKQLLALKAEYKQLTGQEYKPGAQPVQPSPAKTESSSSVKAPELFSQVAQQGELVRKLKSEKAPKVKVLKWNGRKYSWIERHQPLFRLHFLISGQGGRSRQEAART